jgi:hypothetical protein
VVAICNLNPFDFNYADADISSFANDGTIDELNENYTANDYVTAVNDYFRFNLIKKYLNNTFKLYYKDFLIDQLLLSCRFQGKKCTWRDFFYHYDFDYGLCYSFNMGKDIYGNDTKIRTSGQVGWRNGLQLELYTGHAKLQDKFTAIRGYRVLIFDQSNVYPVADDLGVDIATGMATNIGIRRTFTYHLASPYSNCLQSDISQIDWSKNEVLQFMYDNFVQGQYYTTGGYTTYWKWNWTVSYSQSICVMMCFQKYLFEQCGMLFLVIPYLKS